MLKALQYPPPAWQSLYPFTSRYLTLDGHRYHYLDEGTGEPLLLVHGNPTWSFYWRKLVLAWRGRYRLIVPDHLGCGLSDKPRSYEYRLARHIDNLAALVESLQLDRLTLLAHDWGGAIGLGTAVDRPERFRRLVLFNTAAFRSQRMPWRIRACRTPLLGKLAVQGANAFARAALSMATTQPARFSASVKAGYLAPYDGWHGRRAIQAFVDDIPLHPRHPSYGRLTEIENGLARLAHLPTLLVWGMQDWCFTPHFLERFLDFFPQAEVARLSEAGHYVVEDATEDVIARVERFLDDHRLAPAAAEQQQAAP